MMMKPSLITSNSFLECGFFFYSIEPHFLIFFLIATFPTNLSKLYHAYFLRNSVADSQFQGTPRKPSIEGSR